MRARREYCIPDLEVFAENLSDYIGGCEYGVLLRGGDSISIPGIAKGCNFDLLAGVGAMVVCDGRNFEDLSALIDENDWLLGYFSYDMKNRLEDLKSENGDGLQFPELFFFRPKLVLAVTGGRLTVHHFNSISSVAEIDSLINRLQCVELGAALPLNLVFKSRYTKNEYLSTINQVMQHIARGDIYELNLCQEFYNDSCSIEPSLVFNNLYRVSPTPFGAFLKVGERYLMSASPERYLRKVDSLIISQPIKGTAPRKNDLIEDDAVKLSLASDPKERAENVMIVDLVRNDLSKVAVQGSVRVNELCGIYSFPQVHQMISTVTCQLRSNLSAIESIKATFPMGSMTGAPKVRAMQLIEEFERTKRGLYSGAVGYFAPNGDFDFNVVIRSLLYNKENGYLSFSVGGAITFRSNPDNEYAECMLKAKAILTTLNATIENAG